ncbi:MAG: sigma 54-interacting transcriptional regulator [Acidobacteriota bacterium]
MSPKEPEDSDGGTATRSSVESWLPELDPRVPGWTILGHPDQDRVGERSVLLALASGQEAPLARRRPAFSHQGLGGPRPLDEPHISRRPLLLVPGAEAGSLRLLRTEGNRNDVRVDGESLEASRTISAADLERGVVVVLAQRVALLLHRLDPAPPGDVPRYGMVGESGGMLAARRQIQRAASIEVPVLVRGATGTGKELVARALHRSGPRRRGPFQAVNMAAVTPTLAASELFGATKGAYTGAAEARPGLFELADGGTLFLDEVGEAPPEVQAALLRVLETGEVQPVGGGRVKRVDVRLVAATDRDLESAATDGGFSTPLLHRLGGWEVQLPALRHRRDDIGRLLLHFLRQEVGADPAPYPPARLVASLVAFDWPGNVRQLRNIAREWSISQAGGQAEPGPQLRRLLAAVEGTPSAADPTAVPPAIAKSQEAPPRLEGPPPRAPASVGREELLATLKANRWRLKPTAGALGISRSSLYRRMRAEPDLRTAAQLTDDEIEAARQRVGDDLETLADALRVSTDGLRQRLRGPG